MKAVAALGYEVDRMKGSHMILRCAGRRQLSVPRHRVLDRGLLRGLIRDAGLAIDEFIELGGMILSGLAALTIAAGTSEINRNIVAQRGLGPPRD